MDDSIIDEKQNLHRNIRFFHKTLFNKFSEFASKNLPSDLSDMEHRALMCIGKHEGCLSVDLTNALFLGKGTISGLVNGLEEKGFILFRRSDGDGRRFPIYLTEKGRERTALAQELFERFDAQIEENISPEELEELYRIYRKIEKNLKEVE